MYIPKVLRPIRFLPFAVCFIATIIGKLWAERTTRGTKTYKILPGITKYQNLQILPGIIKYQG